MSDINVNAIADVLNNKVDLADGANQASIDYVVETQLPTAENNYTWYRLYKSGWVEQGGRIAGFNSSSVVNYSVTFSKEFADTNYNLTTLSLQRYNASNPSSFVVITRETTGFSGNAIGAVLDGLDWEAKGMSAQGGNQ